MLKRPKADIANVTGIETRLLKYYQNQKEGILLHTLYNKRTFGSDYRRYISERILPVLIKSF